MDDEQPVVDSNIEATDDVAEDEDRDFLEDDFLDNLAVVDSCYSDPENESNHEPDADVNISSPVKDIPKVDDNSKKGTATSKNTKVQEKNDGCSSQNRRLSSTNSKELGTSSRELRKTRRSRYDDDDVSSRRSKDHIYESHRSREYESGRSREYESGRSREYESGRSRGYESRQSREISRRSRERLDACRSRDRHESRRSRERLESHRSSRDKLESHRSSRDRLELQGSQDRLDSDKNRERQESWRSKERSDNRRSKDRLEPRRSADKARNSKDRGSKSNLRTIPDEHHDVRTSTDPITNTSEGRVCVKRETTSPKPLVATITEPIAELDNLVPPGTEDVLLPDEIAVVGGLNTKKTNECVGKLIAEPSKENVGVDGELKITSKRRRTSSGERIDNQKRLCSRSNDTRVMTRERVERDQDRMSRELSIERIREHSRDEERHVDDRPARRLYSLLEEKEQRLRNERFNIELEKRRLQRIEADLRVQRLVPNPYASGSGRRRRSRSSERRSSYAGRREHSRSRDRGGRRYDLELSPVSVDRMSRLSDISFELSRSGSSFGSVHDHYRGRSFSPISSGSHLSRSRSMVSISSEDDNGTRYRRRKRSPFWREMERKLGITLTATSSTSYQYSTPAQLIPDSHIDVSAPPPGIYPVDYPPPATLAPNYSTQVSFPAPYSQQNVGPVPTPPKPTTSRFPPKQIHNPNLVQLNLPPRPTREPAQQPQVAPRPPATVEFVFKVVDDGVPDAPPPPQISGGPSMSLSSFLEASVRVGARLDAVDQDRIARCDAAVEALGVDNVLGMISAGRFILQKCDNLLQYTTKTRFDHPAQESMIKLKSPLLRNTAVWLTFTNPPPSRPITASKKHASNKTASTNSVPNKPTPTNFASTKPTSTNFASTIPTSTNFASTIPTSTNFASIKPASTNPASTTKPQELNSSDPDITFIAEVPKSGNVVLAVLDLEPPEKVEETKIAAPAVTKIATPAVTRAATPAVTNAATSAVTPVSTLKCASCSVSFALRQGFIGPKSTRSVEVQTDFYDDTLWSSIRVTHTKGNKEVGKRRRKRQQKIRDAQIDIVNDDDEEDSETISASVNPAQSPADSVISDTANPDANQSFATGVFDSRATQSLQRNENGGNHPASDSSNVMNRFSFAKGIESYHNNLSSVIPIPIFPSSSAVSGESGYFKKPVNSFVNKPTGANAPSSLFAKPLTGSFVSPLSDVAFKSSAFPKGSLLGVPPYQPGLSARPSPPKGILKGSGQSAPSFQPFNQFPRGQTPRFLSSSPPFSRFVPQLFPPSAPSSNSQQGGGNAAPRNPYQPFGDNNGPARY